MALSTTTFPKLLAKAGYQTGIFGKWRLGDEDVDYAPAQPQTVRCEKQLKERGIPDWKPLPF